MIIYFIKNSLVICLSILIYKGIKKKSVSIANLLNKGFQQILFWGFVAGSVTTMFSSVFILGMSCVAGHPIDLSIDTLVNKEFLMVSLIVFFQSAIFIIIWLLFYSKKKIFWIIPFIASIILWSPFVINECVTSWFPLVINECGQLKEMILFGFFLSLGYPLLSLYILMSLNKDFRM